MLIHMNIAVVSFPSQDGGLAVSGLGCLLPVAGCSPLPFPQCSGSNIGV